MNQSTMPLLSVVVAMVSDTTEKSYDLSHLAGCLAALTDQVDPPPLEILVPYPINLEGIDQLERRFEKVRFLPAADLKWYSGQGGSREHHDELRARGMSAAHGEIIGLLEDHARPDKVWCQKMVEAHELDYVGVGGAMDNGINKPLNWAVYFCDFSKYQNPLPFGETPYASDANVTYKQSALEAIKETWEHAFHETEVNWVLIESGAKLCLSPEAIVYQYRQGLSLGKALAERFIWGRSFAISRSRIISFPKKVLYAVLSPLLPFIIPLRVGINIFRKRRNVLAFIKSLPFIVLLTGAWSAGEMTGYLSK